MRQFLWEPTNLQPILLSISLEIAGFTDHSLCLQEMQKEYFILIFPLCLSLLRNDMWFDTTAANISIVHGYIYIYIYFITYNPIRLDKNNKRKKINKYEKFYDENWVYNYWLLNRKWCYCKEPPSLELYNFHSPPHRGNLYLIQIVPVII